MLLADGNVGIGGDPLALLAGPGSWSRADGRVVVDLAGPGVPPDRAGRAVSARACAARRSAGPRSARTTSAELATASGLGCTDMHRVGERRWCAVPPRTHDGGMSGAPGPRFPALVLAVTVAELVAAVAVPGVDQFDGKGCTVRLVAYPALMLAGSGGVVAARGRGGADPPYVAFGWSCSRSSPTPPRTGSTCSAGSAGGTT